MRTNASTSNYFRLLGRNADSTRSPKSAVLLDVDNLIDYMLEIFTAATVTRPSHRS